MNSKAIWLSTFAVSLTAVASAFAQVYSPSINTAEFNSVKVKYDSLVQHMKSDDTIPLSKLTFAKDGIEFSVTAKQSRRTPRGSETRGDLYTISSKWVSGQMVGDHYYFSHWNEYRRQFLASSRTYDDLAHYKNFYSSSYRDEYVLLNTRPVNLGFSIDQISLTALHADQIGWISSQMDSILQALNNPTALAFLHAMKVDHVQVALTDDRDGVLKPEGLVFGPQIQDDPYLKLLIVARPGGTTFMADAKQLEDQLVAWSRNFEDMKSKLGTDGRSGAEKAASELRVKTENALQILKQ